VLVFVSHVRRELVHLNVTASPTAAWVWRQRIQATPWGRAPRYLIRDRDALYGRDLAPRPRRLGVEPLLTPVRAPRANAVAVRLVGTLRRECLDHLLVVNEQHLRVVLSEFARCYNAARPHRALGLDTPHPRSRAGAGPIRVRAILGGLHHVYERAA
jgi:transposase InsO family protein